MKKELEVKQGEYLRLGVTKEKDGINFAVVSEKPGLSLLLYKKGTSEIVDEISFPEKPEIGNVYAMKLSGLPYREFEYNFSADKEIFLDPYARLIVGREIFGAEREEKPGHEIRCGFSFEDYDWEGDKKPELLYEDIIAYQLHVRGFTRHTSSRIRHKGTFRGVADKIPYLKDLGVNQIKLMPAYEFEELMSKNQMPGMSSMGIQQEQSRVNFWGYVRGDYFAPKSSYAFSKDPVREFKDLVKQCHANGIEVIMEFCFPGQNGLRLMADCLSYWATQYHVDGFHILAEQSLCEILAQDPYLSSTKLIGEYFPTEKRYSEPVSGNKMLAECNEGFLIDARRYLKGDENQLNSFTYRIRRNPFGRGILNYITSHDGFTLNDLVSYDEKHNEANGEQNKDGTGYNYSWNCGEEGPGRKKKLLDLRFRQMKNAFSMLLLSQGTPLLLAGDEFANSQQGNNNAYCQDNELAWIQWSGGRREQELQGFVRRLSAFRRRHRILHMPDELRVMDTVSCGYPDISYHGERAWYGGFEHNNRQIGIMYCGMYADEDLFLYLAYNMHWVEHEFALPHLPEKMKWYLAVDTGTVKMDGVYEEGEEILLQDQNIMPVEPRTVRVLIGRVPSKNI